VVLPVVVHGRSPLALLLLPFSGALATDAQGREMHRVEAEAVFTVRTYGTARA